MRINEDSVRSLSDEDVWRLLDNRERSDKRYSQRHSLQALDPEAQDKRMRECAILIAELNRRGDPFDLIYRMTSLDGDSTWLQNLLSLRR